MYLRLLVTQEPLDDVFVQHLSNLVNQEPSSGHQLSADPIVSPGDE